MRLQKMTSVKDDIAIFRAETPLYDLMHQNA